MGNNSEGLIGNKRVQDCTKLLQREITTDFKPHLRILEDAFVDQYDVNSLSRQKQLQLDLAAASRFEPRRSGLHSPSLNGSNDVFDLDTIPKRTKPPSLFVQHRVENEGIKVLEDRRQQGTRNGRQEKLILDTGQALGQKLRLACQRRNERANEFVEAKVNVSIAPRREDGTSLANNIRQRLNNSSIDFLLCQDACASVT
jgi:hypothetical protein